MTFSSTTRLHYPPELPITGMRQCIMTAIEDNPVVVVTGETGSGKSTQIPKMCLEMGRGSKRLIGSTQPRRIAAITLANRVSEELGGDRQRWVGHKIRFQDRTSRTTRIKFMTDGILLAEAQTDRHFRAYDTLIIDEAHERTLNIDFLLGLIKKTMPRRPDLKVIISSATIDPGKFSRAFGGAPIIEVSGRTYPVEVRYRPLCEADEENGDLSYIDQALAAVDELKSSQEAHSRGDILIFMPTESDIRETTQRIDDRRYFNTLVLPLFGRMAAGDQQRIFRSTIEDKIIVATNVAETSITIPRIRYVIDTGLARISQYNPRSRTQGLPVVPISQASADQRKGRCGRVEAGICIRLYSEEDYTSRAPYTSPEIERANLAEVILRMLFLRLGNIQDFPFLDPPSPAALKDGFAVLRELGAVDDHRRLTQVGKMMARLPLDPRLGRMLLQADREGALRELIILAAAMSAQDPRERPLDNEARADQAHAVFRDRRSDFVSLLKVWEAILGADACLSSRSQLRKFCRDHFLSYRRMKEWQDIYGEILDLLEEIGGFHINAVPASYDALHRSILSGYLSHIALKKDKNIYLGAKNRQAMIFPGSGTFNKAGSWIVAAEMVQTSRLFARTVANIDPVWLEDLGKHLCRSSYSDPHWEKKRGDVVAFERVTLYGLTIVDRRTVTYRHINPGEAREVFIRSALVEGELSGSHGFLEHNSQLIRQIEELESKSRRRDLLVDQEKLYEFYDLRVPDISDSRSLDRFIKEQGGDQNLRMTEADLLRTEPDFEILRQFPDKLRIADLDLPLTYSFKPGDEEDGVTVTVPVHSLAWLPEEVFDWPVPGMIFDKLVFLLKALPKGVRRQFVPVTTTAQALAQRLQYLQGDFYVEVTRCLYEMTGIHVPLDCWDKKSLPAYLGVRYEVVGPDGKSLGTSRNLAELRSLATERHDDSLWDLARKRWERDSLTTLDCGEIPRQIEVGEDALGLARYAYIGLVAEEQTAALRLFGDPHKAMTASIAGIKLIYSLAFSSELKQLKKDWVFSGETVSYIFFMGSQKEAAALLQDYLMRELFELHDPQWPDPQKYQTTLERLKGRLASLGHEMVQEVVEVVKEREATRAFLVHFRKKTGANSSARDVMDLLLGEVEALVPPDFLVRYRQVQIQQLPRYLRALRIRGERAYAAPEKDRLKAAQLSPYEKRYEDAVRELSTDLDKLILQSLDDFRWELEEYKIALFSPEIKTRSRVSAKRLEEKWQGWELWKRQRKQEPRA